MAAAALSMAVVAAIILGVRPPRGRLTLLDVELAWGTTAADSLETRHLPLEIPVAGEELRLVVEPRPGPGARVDRPARLRARILRPNGTHLVGADYRLFPERRGGLWGGSAAWPRGDVAFRPDTTGRHILQVRRMEPMVRRARVRVTRPVGPRSPCGLCLIGPWG